jgi:hypothetical protein
MVAVGVRHEDPPDLVRVDEIPQQHIELGDLGGDPGVVSRGLRDGAWYLLIAGLLVAVGAYLAGPGRGATWVRRRTVALARRARGEAEKGAGALSGTAAGRWIETNLDGLRIGGVVVAFALLLLVDQSWTGVLVLLLFLAAYEIGLTLYSRTRTTASD